MCSAVNVRSVGRPAEGYNTVKETLLSVSVCESARAVFIVANHRKCSEFLL